MRLAQAVAVLCVVAFAIPHSTSAQTYCYSSQTGGYCEEGCSVIVPLVNVCSTVTTTNGHIMIAVARPWSTL